MTAITGESTAAVTDGQRRIPAVDIAGGHLDIRLQAGRVELGHTVGDQLRIRWTVPNRPEVLGGGSRSPRFRLGSDGLRIRCRKARLRIDLPSGMKVRLRLRRGQLTSWGADADLDVTTRAGSVACRELATRVAHIRAGQVNLHFAEVPELIDVRGEQVVIALPGGPYSVSVPADAEVTVPLASVRSAEIPQISVTGSDVRVLAAGTPLILTGEPGDG